MGAYDNWNDLRKQLEKKSEKQLGVYLDVLIMMDEIEKPDIEEMHDVIARCYYGAFGKKPSLNDMESIVSKIPIGVRAQADQWGWDDTEVRESLYRWLDERWRVL